jgi:phenylpropionate dioxygenase-like ring-hydroxylating dioxygenase large terminal subunit
VTQTTQQTGLTEAERPFPTEAERQYPLPPSILDACVYTDPGRYQAEIASIFHHAWFPVVPSGDLPKARDFVVWEQVGQSVVISRLDDGSVSAWHNVCQHRGARLVDGSGNCGRGRFTCPWHGFTYNLAGEVTSVPPLADYLGDIGTELAGYGLDGFTVRFRMTAVMKANWKLVVDAFNETWHVPFTHKDTLAGMVLWRDAVLKITPPHSWMTLPIRGFTDRAEAGADHRQSHLCHYLAFPNTIFSCFPTHLQMWSAWPVSVDETLMCAYEVVGPPPTGISAEKWERHNQRDWDQFLEVLAEDAGVINDIAKVNTSLGQRRNMFNTAESRLTAFHQEVAKRLGEEAILAEGS